MPPKKMTKEEQQKDLKRNVEMTEHRIPIEDLIKDLGTDVDKGLTMTQYTAKAAQVGLNMLTPPAEMNIVLKFILSLTDFFSMLLWGGGALCFVGYGMEGAMDYLYLGIVLFVVVFATGVFGFIQNQKSDNLMKSFANMLPPKVSPNEANEANEAPPPTTRILYSHMFGSHLGPRQERQPDLPRARAQPRPWRHRRGQRR